VTAEEDAQAGLSKRSRYVAIGYMVFEDHDGNLQAILTHRWIQYLTPDAGSRSRSVALLDHQGKSKSHL
jgi:hypothetical protein